LLTATAAASTATNVVLQNVDSHLRIKCSMPSDFNAYTVSIDPAFTTPRRLSLSVIAEIEHTRAMSVAIV